MIYKKIKEIRLFKNVTVDFAASELEVSISDYLAIENGTVDMKLSKIFKLAVIFNVCAYEFFDDTEFGNNSTCINVGT
ncbi:XRE family transcriptional regulator [Flavobacterium sp. GSP27]|uniref:XRE family transcriptional regulator n=1 Tax=Flavobacterium bomense TaxID=2497483 RepID=A0A432CI92_9FLAO|nr:MULTISPECIES: helix-turn-helix transcriptional regulator [Flavobacterium]RTZ01918.1 XRE family transcriptional regulator [Flavobacterium sp. GSP6]RTZ02040.1 XRE family transcriptional regulator [Flavobacterium bomense]RTZ10590.1 XRE family transcriptional regulator [Flavobacterium sp. GSP27]